MRAACVKTSNNNSVLWKSNTQNSYGSHSNYLFHADERFFIFKKNDEEAEEERKKRLHGRMVTNVVDTRRNGNFRGPSEHSIVVLTHHTVLSFEYFDNRCSIVSLSLVFHSYEFNLTVPMYALALNERKLFCIRKLCVCLCLCWVYEDNEYVLVHKLYRLIHHTVAVAIRFNCDASEASSSGIMNMFVVSCCYSVIVIVKRQNVDREKRHRDRQATVYVL